MKIRVYLRDSAGKASLYNVQLMYGWKTAGFQPGDVATGRSPCITLQIDDGAEKHAAAVLERHPAVRSVEFQ
jgi:hypothetical protein